MSKHRKAAASVAVVVATATLLAACTSQQNDPGPTPTSTTAPSRSATPTPTPTVDPEIAAAESAALEAYQGYWDAKILAFADPSAAEAPSLAQFAVDTALADVRAGVHSLNSSGITVIGAPVLAPEVTDIKLGETSTATITDCVDVTAWQPVFAASGESAVDPNQALRVFTTSTAYVYDGRGSAARMSDTRSVVPVG